ncbi:unnamed protein product [Prorocentrum cordatum]|uniref:MPN domain-containing protein n=1 Tax=Prorocentrum cordatum TaxID=2364126 RepID=A0ABN9R5R1_9DINO|nr:unnamed protein product [Polarella glacialis]
MVLFESSYQLCAWYLQGHPLNALGEYQSLDVHAEAVRAVSRGPYPWGSCRAPTDPPRRLQSAPAVCGRPAVNLARLEVRGGLADWSAEDAPLLPGFVRMLAELLLGCIEGHDPEEASSTKLRGRVVDLTEAEEVCTACMTSALHLLLIDPSPPTVLESLAAGLGQGIALEESDRTANEKAVNAVMKATGKRSGHTFGARLDLVVSWPGAPAPAWVDVTDRSAAESGPAERLVGHAAADAERRERGSFGAAVWPFAVEAEWRLGAAAQQFIAATAAAARRVATLPGEPGGQQGADYARQIASRVSGALVARLADLLPAAVPGAGPLGASAMAGNFNLQRLLGQIPGMGGGGQQQPEQDAPLPDTAEQVYISSLALLKMLKHGRAGVPMEVMGLMLGEFIDDYTIRVVDVFSMPQSGNSVSVEAVDPVFQTKMLDMLKQTGRSPRWSWGGTTRTRASGAGSLAPT